MIGAVIGDVIGSIYEGYPIKTEDFPLFSEHSTFTDDTVLTIATADAILQQTDYTSLYKKWGRRYPNAGYGGSFRQWLSSNNRKAYNSWGNGAAMRVSPVSFVYNTLKQVETEAEKSASVTHNHPEGIESAKAVAAAIFLARADTSKNQIQGYIEKTYGYSFSTPFNIVREEHSFEVRASLSVPQAIHAFLVSENFEDAIRKAVSLGGDSDTQACIAGAIAHAYYKTIPENILLEVYDRLPEDLLKVILSFNKRFKIYY